MQKIGVDFFSKVKMISHLSKKDGQIYYVGIQANVEKNTYERDIYALKDGKGVALTRSHNVGSYKVGDKGLWWLASEEGKTNVMVLPYGMGEAYVDMTLEGQVSDLYMIDDNRYFLTRSRNLKKEALMNEGMSEKEALETLKKKAEQCVEYEEVPFWFNGAGDISMTRRTVYYYDGEKEIALTKDNEKGSIALVDGERCFFTVNALINGMQEDHNHLMVFENGQCKELKLFETPDYYNIYKKADNTYLVLANCNETELGNENAQSWLYDYTTGALTRIYDGSYYEFGNSVGSDIKMGNKSSEPIFEEDGIVYISTVVNYAPMVRMSYTGEFTQITGEEAMIQEFIEDGDGYLAIAMKDNLPNEIYEVAKDGTMTRISCLNTDLAKEYEFYVPQKLTFTNEVGDEIEGWVIFPDDGEQSIPAILDIHGGPRTVYGCHFFHEMQWWAAQGYAVMFTNPTGSSGRGNRFADIYGRYGTIEYRDLMKFVDVVLETYPRIDLERLGVTGGSYGGFMTNWIIGHTSRFKAAASQRSISNWTMFENTSDIGHGFAKAQLGYSQWENMPALWDQSPIQFAPNVTTPTLFIHSDMDKRCWQGEGIAMFMALKVHGVDSKICMFKDETHELSRSGRPQNRIRRLEEILGWMDKYIQH